MKSQWMIVCGLGLALLTAVFAVFNTGDVRLSYGGGEAEVPLIVVISAAVLIGGLIVALFGTMRPYRLQKDRDKLMQSNRALRAANETLQTQLTEVQAAYALARRERENGLRPDGFETAELVASTQENEPGMYSRSWEADRTPQRNKSN